MHFRFWFFSYFVAFDLIDQWFYHHTPILSPFLIKRLPARCAMSNYRCVWLIPFNTHFCESGSWKRKPGPPISSTCSTPADLRFHVHLKEIPELLLLLPPPPPDASTKRLPPPVVTPLLVPAIFKQQQGFPPQGVERNKP